LGVGRTTLYRKLREYGEETNHNHGRPEGS
jgi:DNA-binding NtrC family response regulator